MGCARMTHFAQVKNKKKQGGYYLCEKTDWLRVGLAVLDSEVKARRILCWSRIVIAAEAAATAAFGAAWSSNVRLWWPSACCCSCVSPYFPANVKPLRTVQFGVLQRTLFLSKRTNEHCSISNDSPIAQWGILAYSKIGSNATMLMNNTTIIITFAAGANFGVVSWLSSLPCSHAITTRLWRVDGGSYGRLHRTKVQEFLAWCTMVQGVKKVEDPRARPHPPPSYVGVGGGFVHLLVCVKKIRKKMCRLKRRKSLGDRAFPRDQREIEKEAPMKKALFFYRRVHRLGGW